MVELHFATVDSEIEDANVDCSWSSIIRGIERYAAFHPAQARDLDQWAQLLEGIRQVRSED